MLAQKNKVKFTGAHTNELEKDSLRQATFKVRLIMWQCRFPHRLWRVGSSIQEARFFGSSEMGARPSLSRNLLRGPLVEKVCFRIEREILSYVPSDVEACHHCCLWQS